MTRGDWRAKANRALVAQCKRALERAREKGCVVGWRHVKHSGDKWNDRADRLADEGAGAPPGGEDVCAEEEGEGGGEGVYP